MQSRDKILIVNALHRSDLYQRPLERNIAALNALNNVSHPEYVVERVDFDVSSSGLEGIGKIAAFTAQKVLEYKPILIYQCVDYNAGYSGAKESSLPRLIACNDKETINVPILYILDGSNHEARVRDEMIYGNNNKYCYIIKFLSGLRQGALPIPSFEKNGEEPFFASPNVEELKSPNLNPNSVAETFSNLNLGEGNNKANIQANIQKSPRFFEVNRKDPVSLNLVEDLECLSTSPSPSPLSPGQKQSAEGQSTLRRRLSG